MSLVLNSSGGGSVTIQEPTTASNVTQTLVAATGTLAPLISGTAVTASGTSVDFTGIPSWAKRITVMLSGISTNGTSNYQIQIGTSSGVETSGYLGSTWLANTTNTGYSTGFLAATGVDATTVFHCVASLTLVNAATNLWMFSMVGGRVSATGVIGGGSKTTASVLDRVRITTVNGTDTFDAGTINIMYE